MNECSNVLFHMYVHAKILWSIDRLTFEKGSDGLVKLDMMTVYSQTSWGHCRLCIILCCVCWWSKSSPPRGEWNMSHQHSVGEEKKRQIFTLLCTALSKTISHEQKFLDWQIGVISQDEYKIICCFCIHTFI